MTKIRPVFVALALAWLASIPARGQVSNGGDLYIAAHAGVDDYLHEDTFLYGGRIGGYFTDHFSIETNVNYILFKDPAPHLFNSSVGLLYDFNRVAIGWHPSITAGVGAERRELFHGSGEWFAFLGGALEYHFSPHWGVRLDARDINFYNRSGSTFSGERNAIQAMLGIVLHCACYSSSPSPVPSELPTAPPAATPPPPPSTGGAAALPN